MTKRQLRLIEQAFQLAAAGMAEAANDETDGEGFVFSREFWRTRIVFCDLVAMTFPDRTEQFSGLAAMCRAMLELHQRED